MITRRRFLGLSGLLPAVLGLPRGVLADAKGGNRLWHHYEIYYRFEIKRQGFARLWIPLPIKQTDYQQFLGHEWQGNADAVQVAREAKYGSNCLYAEWRASQKPRVLDLVVQIKTCDRQSDFSDDAREPNEDVSLYLQPTSSMPIDGLVAETASRIVSAIDTPLARARAIYDWTVKNTYRDPKVNGCGIGDINNMLRSGNLGGKCADINALFVGLVRAVGIPAREVYGQRVAGSKYFRSLGASGNISKAQHCRAEFYIEGIGWIPVDPADVRKVLLEEKRSLNNPRVAELRQRLFGFWEMNWVAFNYGRDYFLQPATRQPLNYFMYPYLETPNGAYVGIQPDNFDYRMTAKPKMV